jgi:type I restriction enzyme S subunit
MTTPWPKVPLKYLVSKIGSGKTPKGGAEVYTASGVMLLRSQNVHFDGLRLDDVVHIDEDMDENMSSTRVHPNDVLLNITGASIGRCTVVPAEFEAANVNQHVCIIRPNTNRLLPAFLNLVLQTPTIQNEIRFGENGSSREGLNFEQVGAFEIPLPPMPQQVACVKRTQSLVERVEGLIREKQGLVDLLAEKRRALIAHAVTRGLNPAAPLRDSGIEWLGAIPAHWQVSRIAWLLAERDERGRPDLPLLEVSIHGGVRLREFSEDRIEQTAADPNSYKVAIQGDICFNKMRMWQGAVGAVPQDGLVSPDYVVAKPTVDLDSGYFGRLFQTPACSAEAGRRSHGIVWDRLRLYWEEFRDIAVPVPPLAEQRKIVETTDRTAAEIDALRHATEATITLLEERRTSLIAETIVGAPHCAD